MDKCAPSRWYSATLLPFIEDVDNKHLTYFRKREIQVRTNPLIKRLIFLTRLMPVRVSLRSLPASSIPAARLPVGSSHAIGGSQARSLSYKF